MKYITFVPLIGGMAIANANVVGHKPECVLSYDVFQKNESNLKYYWPDVKWYILDSEHNDILTDDKPSFDDIDFVSSVCPCAGMSMLNTANRDAENATNNWLYKVAEFTLSKIKPKVYWGENAPGLYSEQNKKVQDTLKEFADKYGYSFTIYKTDTYLHGIPQHRVRTFFFFWKGDNAPLVPWHNHPSELPFEKWILDKNVGTQRTYFIDKNPYNLYPEMRWIMDNKCRGSYEEYVKFFYDQIDKYNVKTPYDYIQYHNAWQEYRDWLEKDPQKDVKMSDQGSRTPWYYVNYRWKKIHEGKGFFAPQPVVYKGATNAIISKNMNWTLHPVECRFLNTREILSMMGMPSDFELVSNNLQHVTQNVPVKTAENMTEEVVKFINNELEMSNSSFVMQDNLRQVVDKCDVNCVKLF